MKLYATPMSHFSRKIRILLEMYQIPYEFIDVGNVADGDVEKYGGNPLMKVPVLHHENEVILDSDHIAEFIVRMFDPDDRFAVNKRDVFSLNSRAVLNGLMLEEVKFILAARTGVPVESYRFFDDARETIIEGLKWLDRHADRFDSENLSYKEFHLVCAWDHLVAYDILPMEFKNLIPLTAAISRHPIVSATAPKMKKKGVS